MGEDLDTLPTAAPVEQASHGDQPAIDELLLEQDLR